MNLSHKPWLIIWHSSNNASLSVMWSKATFHYLDLNTLLDLLTMALTCQVHLSLLLCWDLMRKCILTEMYSIYFNGFNIFHLLTNHTTTLLVILLHKVANHLLPKKEERKGNTEYQCFHELDQRIIETKLKKYVVERKGLSMCAYHVMLLCMVTTARTWLQSAGWYYSMYFTL